MKYRATLAYATYVMCLTTTLAAMGQSQYCTVGLQPDGYIDFSTLPKAPNLPLTVPYTATIPVHGIGGLTVDVMIAPLAHGNDTGPAYSVDGGTLHINGIPQGGSASPVAALTLNFNKHVAGVKMSVTNTGAGPYSYTLQADDPNSMLPVTYSQTTNTVENFAIHYPQAQNLEAIGYPAEGIQTATMLFTGQGYRALMISNVRVQSVSLYPDLSTTVPRSGLEQWLRGDSVGPFEFGPDGYASSEWPDVSGKGHGATYSSPAFPNVDVDGASCQQVLQFKGNQSFSFNLPIAGWSELTIFLVAKATNANLPSDSFTGNSAIYWEGSTPWGSTFISPYQTNVYARFGSNQPNNTFYYTRPAGGIGQDFTITRLVHDHATDSLYVNGLEVQKREGRLPVLAGETGAATIGKGANGTYFDGEIGELLVYDRVLSPNEAATVEYYLRSKFGTR